MESLGAAALATSTVAPHLIIRSWHRRRDRRAAGAWPADNHQLVQLWSLQRPVAGVDRRTSWAIDDRASGALIGRLTLREWDASSTTARLGLYLAPGWRDAGRGQDILRLFVAQITPALGLRQLRVDVAVSNQRARCCFHRAGFGHLAFEWRAIPADLVEALRVALHEPALRDLQPFIQLDAPCPRAMFDEMALVL